ncbi:hypothetical protein ACJRO7_034242 [Eucalyptus globulus]|uniref:Uncharacterized protein n=1 Tax=Eucalyptus globulus TaxID=34317 RepID=A0ABD3J8D1_EUCGL
MDGKSSSELSLPWFWIIEYLAKFEQVKPSLLHGIIKAAPELPAHLGKNMEEVVSLRCLEELCGPRNGSMNSTWSSLGSKAKIDTSKSCKNGSASDLEVTANELLKWDLHSFLMHKRTSVPKTALEEGRLADVCHLNRTVIHNGGHTGLTCAPDVGDTYAPNTVDEPNLVSRSTNHVEPLVGDDGIRKCLPTKRNHTDVHAENIERNCNKDQHHDAHSDAKRAKQQDSDEIKDREESPINDGCFDREVANLVKDHMGAVDDDQSLEGDGRHYVQPRTWFSVDDPKRVHDSIEKTKNSESARASEWGQTFTSHAEDYVVHVVGMICPVMVMNIEKSRQHPITLMFSKTHFGDLYDPIYMIRYNDPEASQHQVNLSRAEERTGREIPHLSKKDLNKQPIERRKCPNPFLTTSPTPNHPLPAGKKPCKSPLIEMEYFGVRTQTIISEIIHSGKPKARRASSKKSQSTVS